MLAGIAMGEAGDLPPGLMDRDLRFDIGSMQVKPHLGFGWSVAEQVGPRTYRWINHLEADVHFSVPAARDGEIWLDAKPLYLPYRRQTVALYINSQYVGQWICGDDPVFTWHRLPVTASLLNAGDNTLTIRTAYRTRIGTDSRELSLCVDTILIRFP